MSTAPLPWWPPIPPAPRSARAPVSRATLFAGDYGTPLNIPDGISRLEISVAASNQNVDLNLYVRVGRDIALSGGRAVADYRSEGPGGSKKITITASSGTTLPPGTWNIGYGVLSMGVAISGSGSATYTVPGVEDPTVVTDSCDFSLPAVPVNTLFAGIMAAV